MVNSVVVSVSFPDNGTEDSGIMMVGQVNGLKTDILNVFTGKEAHDIYTKLLTKKEKKHE